MNEFPKIKIQTALQLAGITAERLLSPVFWLQALRLVLTCGETNKPKLLYDALLPWLCGRSLPEAYDGQRSGDYRTLQRISGPAGAVAALLWQQLRTAGLSHQQAKQLTFAVRQFQLQELHDALLPREPSEQHQVNLPLSAMGTEDRRLVEACLRRTARACYKRLSSDPDHAEAHLMSARLVAVHNALRQTNPLLASRPQRRGAEDAAIFSFHASVQHSDWNERGLSAAPFRQALDGVSRSVLFEQASFATDE